MAIEKVTLNKITPATAPTSVTTSASQSKSKTLQSEITRKQQHMKKLSSDSSMTATEIEQKRRELQKEIDELNRKLELMRQEQKEEDARVAKEQAQKAARQKELREQSDVKKVTDASKPATNSAEDLKRADSIKQNSNTRVTPQEKEEPVSMSAQEVHKMLSADNLVQKERVQEVVETKTEGTIHVLESEIKQDKGYGSDTSAKEAEIDSIRQKENFWTDAQKQKQEKEKNDEQAKTTIHKNAQVVLDQI